MADPISARFGSIVPPALMQDLLRYAVPAGVQGAPGAIGGDSYANAFYDGKSLVFASGDGPLSLHDFADPIVNLHEAAHAAIFAEHPIYLEEVQQCMAERMATAPSRFQADYAAVGDHDLQMRIFVAYPYDREYFVAAMLHAVAQNLPGLANAIESQRKGMIDGCWGAPSSYSVVTHILTEKAAKGELPEGFTSAAQVWERIAELAAIAGQ